LGNTISNLETELVWEFQEPIEGCEDLSLLLLSLAFHFGMVQIASGSVVIKCDVTKVKLTFEMWR
jgi:hypothetical protein